MCDIETRYLSSPEAILNCTDSQVYTFKIIDVSKLQLDPIQQLMNHVFVHPSSQLVKKLFDNNNSKQYGAIFINNCRFVYEMNHEVPIDYIAMSPYQRKISQVNPNQEFVDVRLQSA